MHIRLVKKRTGVFLLFTLVLPWFILVTIKTNGLWLEEFIFTYNLGRFSAPMEGHGDGFWLTLLFVFAGLLPFAVFLPQAITHKIKYRTNKAINFALVAAFVVIVFFMLSRTKLPNYTVPAYPFLTLLIGHFLEYQLRKRNIKTLLVPIMIYSLILLGFPFLIYYGLKGDPFLSGNIKVVQYFIFPILALPILYYLWFKNKALPTIFCLAGGYILLSLLFFYGAFPKIDQQNPVITSPIHKLKNEDLYYYKIYNPSFSFYLQKPIKDITKVPNIQQAEGYLITRKKDLEKLTVNYRLIFEGKDLFESPTSVIVNLSPL